MPEFRYHVTARRNLKSIRKEGICPWYAKGKLQASWYVRVGRIHWAMRHVSERHGIPLDELVVIRVNVSLNLFVNRGGGKYTLSFPVRQPDFAGVYDIFEFGSGEVWEEEGSSLFQR